MEASDHDASRGVRIHIDRVAYTGTKHELASNELRELAGIPPELGIWREIGGPHEDVAVEDGTAVRLEEDMHFYSRQRDYTVIVNGRAKKVTTNELSFDEIVKLAFEIPPTGENVVFTVTYRLDFGPFGQSTYSLLA